MVAIKRITCVHGRNFHVLNQDFMSLLPNKDGVVDIGDSKPISLVLGLAKSL